MQLHVKNKTARTLNTQGFASILEVTITAIVFTIAAVGLISTITMISPEATQSSKRLEAAYIAKSFMEELRISVDEGTWNLTTQANPLRTGVTITDSVTQDGVQYDISYTLTEITPNLRRMELTVDYPN